jgi:hypothetical protein
VQQLIGPEAPQPQPVTFALAPHELAMRVFDQTLAPIVEVLPGVSRSIRISLYRNCFSHNMYMWLMSTPAPSLPQLEQYIHQLSVAMGIVPPQNPL